MANEEQQCIFCHIASGKIPAKKVFEDDKVSAVLDINPATPGHVLVIPKQHVSIMPQMSEELIAHIGMVSKQLSHALIRALKVDGTSIFVANGVAAGQRAPHFLLHVIPRRKDDGVSLDLPRAKIDDKMMQQVFEKLAPSIAKQFGVEPPKIKTAVKKQEKPQPPEKPKAPEPEEKPDSEEPESEQKPGPSGLDEITEFLTGGK